MTVPVASPLAWLSAILWPDDTARLVPIPRDRAPRGPEWWASPSAEHPHILIPADPRSARVAVRRYHDGQRARERLRSVAAEAVVRSGPIGRRLLDRQRVGIRGEPGSGLIEELRRQLGAEDLTATISLAQPKSNRKPILQLITAGRVLGYAKVGWNQHTADLIGNEAAWLRRRPDPPIVAPTVLHELEIGAHTVLVISAVSGDRWPRRRRRTCPLDLVRAVASLGERGVIPVPELAWTGRVHDLLGAATTEERAIVDHTFASIGGRQVERGAWHGDLAPWNMLTSARGIGVIDWEFAADDVPVGFDVCHFHTQVGMELDGLDADQALDRAAGKARRDLARLGQDEATIDTVWRLYLVELARRTLLLRTKGLVTDGVHQGSAALRRLDVDRQRCTPDAPTVSDRT